MKNALKAVSAIALTGLLLLAGCVDILNPDLSKSQAGDVTDGAGIVQIQIGDSTARTLVPAGDNFTAYGVKATKSADTVVLDPSAGTPAPLTLQPGTWVITVTAYTGTMGSYKASAKGSTTVTVVAGQTATANIILNQTADVNATGTFHYSVNFGDIDFADLDSAALTLTSDDAGTGTIARNLKDFAYVPISATTNAGEITLASGIYTLDIVLTSGRQINGSTLNIYRKETVYIFPGLTTSTENYVFSDSQLTAYVYLKGRARIQYSSNATVPPTAYIPTEVYVKSNGVAATADVYDGTADYAGIKRDIADTPDVDGYYDWMIQVPSQSLKKVLTGSLDFSFKATTPAETNAIYTPWSQNLNKISIISNHGNESTTVTLTGTLVSLTAGSYITGHKPYVFAGTYDAADKQDPITVTATGANNIVQPGSVYLNSITYPLTLVSANPGNTVEIYRLATVPSVSSVTLNAAVYDPTSILPLTFNTWEPAPVLLNTTTTRRYEFTAPIAGIYYVYANASYTGGANATYGDGTYSARINVSAVRNAGGTLFTNVQTLYSSPRSVSMTASEKITITVQGANSSYLSAYAIGIGPSHAAKPGTTFTALTNNTWKADDLALSDVDWFEFEAPANGNYYLWLNNDRSNYGDGTKTARVNVAAYSEGSNLNSFAYNSGAYTTGQSLGSLSAGQKVYVRVTPTDSTHTGTYAIGINGISDQVRPETVVTQINANTWANGEITTGSTVDWYEFEAPSAGDYYLWRDDGYSYWTGTKPAGIYARLYRSNGGQLVNSYNTYDPMYKFTMSAGEKVYVQASYYSSSYGNYAVGISDTPVPIGVVPTTLTSGTWTPTQYIYSSNAYQDKWYKFDVTTPNFYYVWRNGYSGAGGDGNCYLVVDLEVYTASGSSTTIGGWTDAYNSGQVGWSLSAGDTIYVRARYNNNYYDYSFAVGISTGYSQPTP
ncbi:hypothetical protein FACS1894109_07360 [Spirochaetia bacterium]|nr:hypothetical protein FACS1894109_07360 [Spirochaetia bacterium]